jgi:hypothetical protein
MTLTADQGAIWKQISHVYYQWDPSRTGRMPVRELAERLPAVAPDLIGETLAQAAADRIADVGHVGEDPTFKPLQH